MPRYIGTEHESGMVVRHCDVSIDGVVEGDCVSLLDLTLTEAPAEYVYLPNGRQIVHRRYTNREHAEKRSLPWGMLPAADGTFERSGTYRRWYDSILLSR